MAPESQSVIVGWSDNIIKPEGWGGGFPVLQEGVQGENLDEGFNSGSLLELAHKYMVSGVNGKKTSPIVSVYTIQICDILSVVFMMQ